MVKRGIKFEMRYIKRISRIIKILNKINEKMDSRIRTTK